MKAQSLRIRIAVTLLSLGLTQLPVVAQNGALQFTLKGGWASASEPVSNVLLVGPYAYLVVVETGLQVLDVSSPTNPVPLGRYDAAQRINGFHVAGHLASLATGDSITQTNDPGVLEILDVSQPANLVFLSSAETHARANSVCVAVALPSFVKSRWSSSGVPVAFQFIVVDSLTGLVEVERWVLSWGTHATVINPPALATRVRSIAATLVHRYPTSTDTTANP